MGNFTVSTSLAADGSALLHVRAEIDMATSAEQLAAVMNEVTRRRPPKLLVDMLHVTFIDSNGLAALLAPTEPPSSSALHWSYGNSAISYNGSCACASPASTTPSRVAASRHP